MRTGLTESALFGVLLSVAAFVLPAPVYSQQNASPQRQQNAPQLSEFQQRQVAEHLQLLKALGQGRSVDAKVQFEKVYKPIAYVNKRDFEKHKAIVEQLLQKATEIQEKQPEKAAEYARVGKAYKQCAECNLAVVNAYEKGLAASMRQALTAVLEAEKVVAKVTGKPVVRDWFTPWETEACITTEQARQRRAAKGA